MRMKYFFVYLLLLPVVGQAQTSAFGNYEVYIPKAAQNSIGYLTTTLTFPAYLGNVEIRQNGLLYQNRHTCYDLTSWNFEENKRVRLFTQSSYRIGFSAGEGSTDTVINFFRNKNFKMYTMTVDFYTFGIASEFTYVFDRNKAVTVQLAIDLVNAGLNGSMLDGGDLENNFIAQINVIPFVIRPSVFFDFGRRGIGIAFYINPYNVLEYYYAPNNSFSDDDIGIKFTSSRIKRYAVEIIFVL